MVELAHLRGPGQFLRMQLQRMRRALPCWPQKVFDPRSEHVAGPVVHREAHKDPHRNRRDARLEEAARHLRHPRPRHGGLRPARRFASPALPNSVEVGQTHVPRWGEALPDILEGRKEAVANGGLVALHVHVVATLHARLVKPPNILQKLKARTHDAKRTAKRKKDFRRRW